MKKTILFVAFSLIGLSANVFGQTFTYNGINYEVTSTSPNKATVGNNSGYSGAAVIPDSAQNGSIWYSVTGILGSAFWNCSGLTSVTLPNSVTTIGKSAFRGCERLTSITIPNSVTTIGESAFEHCSGLTSVTLPNSVTTIGESAFKGCERLTSITIPNSVTTIGKNTFADCYGLISVTLGNSVTTIGNAAFADCSGLTSVALGNSVTTIGNAAFYRCSGLTSLTLPKSVTTIGNNAFDDCSGLTKITSLAINPPAMGGDVFYNVPTTIPVHVPCGSENAYKAADDWSNFTNYTACVGLNDIETMNFNIYPNPASDKLFIEGEGFDGVIVYDVLGKEVLASNKKEMDISSLPKGVYNVRILQSGKTVGNRKIVRQ